MEKVSKRILLCLMLICSVSAYGQQQPSASTNIVKIGMQVPDFKYEADNGKFNTISKMKGKIILINFFATWCAPCRKELPLVESEIWKKHEGSSKFLMLTFGREHSKEEVQKFKKEQGFSFPFYPDPKRAVFGLFATQGIPRSYLIDEEGKIIFTSEGFEEKHFKELVELINNKL